MAQGNDRLEGATDSNPLGIFNDTKVDGTMELDFHKFRDYRIVMAQDATGEVREGIFIPFAQNYIRVKRTTKGTEYFMRFMVIGRRGKRGQGKVMADLVPTPNEEIYHRMIEEGLLQPHQKYKDSPVGIIFHAGDDRQYTNSAASFAYMREARDWKLKKRNREIRKKIRNEQRLLRAQGSEYRMLRGDKSGRYED